MWLQSKDVWGSMSRHMSEAKDSTDTLNIRCPKCRQRFSVGDNLMDRMVECGGCESRFRINDDVIMRSKKFYPGERGGLELNRFQRVPLSAAAPEGLATMRYAEFSHPEQLEPVSPQRVLAGIAGVSLMAVIALMLIFAVNPGGAFSVMPQQNKLIIAGFTSLLGIALLVYGNPKARVKAAAFGILLGAGIISLPFFFKGQPISKNNIVGFKPGKVEPMFPAGDADPLIAMKDQFGTKPLEVEQERLQKAGSGKRAFGIFLTNLVPRNKYIVRDFLIRDTEASLSSHPYPRDDGNYLMILTEVSMDIEQVAEIAGRLGKLEKTHPEIGVIEVRVDNTQFVAGSAEKLNNKTDPAFYELNQRELANIDLDRVKRAVERLADAEPTIYRTDISRTLIELMGKQGVTFHDELAKALLVWEETPGQSSGVALAALRKTVAAGGVVSENLVKLVTRGKAGDAIPTLNQLWLQSPGEWERYYVEFGAPIVPGLLAQLASAEAPLRRSAIRLLGGVGTDEVLPQLEKLSADPDPEARVLAERAVASIKER